MCPTMYYKGEGEVSCPFSKVPGSFSNPGITCESFSLEKPFRDWRGSNQHELEKSEQVDLELSL